MVSKTIGGAGTSKSMWINEGSPASAVIEFGANCNAAGPQKFYRNPGRQRECVRCHAKLEVVVAAESNGLNRLTIVVQRSFDSRSNATLQAPRKLLLSHLRLVQAILQD